MYRRILCFALCVLLGPAAAVAGVQYYVRLDGGDNGICDGLVNGPDPGTGAIPRACAFQSPNYAVTRMTGRDDLRIGEGTYGRFQIPAGLNGIATDPTIMEGDPALNRTQIIIQPAPGEGEGIRGDDVDYLTLRHMNIRGGTKNAIRFETNIGWLQLSDLLLNGFENTCCTQPQFGGDIRASAIRVNGGFSVIVEDIGIVGHTNDFLNSHTTLLGTKAMSIFLGSTESVVRRVKAYNMLGTFVQEDGSYNRIEDNTVVGSNCDGDDGCIQIYHDSGVLVRFNVFDNIEPIDSMPIIKFIRRNNSYPTASGAAYNNTFIVKENPARVYRLNGIQVETCCGATLTEDIVILNNIFRRVASSNPLSAQGVIVAQSCPQAPAVLRVDHNLFFEVPSGREFNNAASCPGTFGTGDVIGQDPLLDTLSYAPPMGSPACGAGDQGYLAWDLVPSRKDMGAKACPVPPPPGGGGDPGCRPVCYN